MGSVRSATVSKSESRRLVVEGRGSEGSCGLAVGDILGQELGFQIALQEVCINVFQVATANEVVEVDVSLSEDLFDTLDVGVVVIVAESEALGALQSELSLDTCVELVSEGLEGDNEFNIETSGGLSLPEEDNLDEGVDVVAVQVLVNGNEELLKRQNWEADAGNLLTLGRRVDEGLVHIKRVVV